MERTYKEESIAFKVTPSIVKDKEITDEGEEDFAMFIRKVRKIFYRRDDKATFGEQDHKASMKERRRK